MKVRYTVNVRKGWGGIVAVVCCCHRCRPERLALCNRRVMKEMSSRFSLSTVALMFQLLAVYFPSIPSVTVTDPLLLLHCFSWNANLSDWPDTELLFCSVLTLTLTLTLRFSSFTWLSGHSRGNSWFMVRIPVVWSGVQLNSIQFLCIAPFTI